MQKECLKQIKRVMIIMNKEDYKEIAKIIFVRFNRSKQYPKITKEQHIKQISKDFADYFEKEDKKMKKEYGKKPYGMDKKGFNLWWKFHHFDKKQFLKDCGVM